LLKTIYDDKKIRVKNFRVFKDYAEFEIRPITILTGSNNS
jgi:AAA15 family ATPase/GTPase